MSNRVTIRRGLEEINEAEKRNQRRIAEYLRDEQIRKQKEEQYHDEIEEEDQ